MHSSVSENKKAQGWSHWFRSVASWLKAYAEVVGASKGSSSSKLSSDSLNKITQSKSVILSQREGIKKVLLILLFFVYASNASAATWTQVNTDGFGFSGTDVTSLTIFNSQIYASTPTSNRPVVFAYNTSTNTWSQVSISAITQDTNNGTSDVGGVFNNQLILFTNNENGTQVYSGNGSSSWTRINIDGFGSTNNTSLEGDSVVVFNGKLYVATSTEFANNVGTQIWEYSGSGTTWTQINTDGFGSSNHFEANLEVINNKLYAATKNRAATGGETTGGQVWEYSGSGTTWAQINTDGFGDTNNAHIYITSHNNQLYAGTKNGTTGSEVWQYSGSGTTWAQINTDGFGDVNNTLAKVFSINGQLYVGTQNRIIGGGVWQYSGSGTTWSQVNTNGFGDVNNRRIHDMALLGSNIYVSTLNVSTGVEVWASSDLISTPLPTIDTYDAATGQLTIPSVLVGATTYTNVVITVGSIISVGSGAAVGTIDTYDAATNQLTIPSVLVGITTYTNVVITVGSVISVGGGG